MGTRQFVAVSGAAIAVSLLCIFAKAQLPGDRGDLPKVQGVEVTPKRQAQRPHLDPQQQREYLEAAKAFARQVAGDDDKRFVEVFERAYAVAEEVADPAAVRRSLTGTAVSVPVTPIGLSWEQRQERRAEATNLDNSIYNDPRYAANYRKLLEEQGIPRIVGGAPTDSAEFPDCVAVGYGFGWCCTGALVAPNVVVTAGHCAQDCASRVYLGLDTESPAPDRIVPVKKVLRHEGYQGAGPDLIKNDLTVLILERDVADVRPRAIARGEVIDSAAWCRVVGFGTTDVFGQFGYGRQRKVDVAIASPSCGDPAAQNRYGCFADHEIVAGGAGKDSCGGDSGGPLYIRDGGKWYLAGATSRATKEWRLSGHACGEGGIYVRIDRYADWIRDVARANGGHWPDSGPATGGQ